MNLAGVSVNTCVHASHTQLVPVGSGRAGIRLTHLRILLTQPVPGTQWARAAAWSMSKRDKCKVQALGFWTIHHWNCRWPEGSHQGCFRRHETRDQARLGGTGRVGMCFLMRVWILFHSYWPCDFGSGSLSESQYPLP